MYMKNPGVDRQYLDTPTIQIQQPTMNCAVDRTGLCNSPHTGIEYIVIARDKLTCFQRIRSLSTRNNHLHGLTRSEYYVAGIEYMCVRSVRSGSNLIGTGDQLIREGVHGGKVKSEMGAKGTRSLNLIVAAIKGSIRRIHRCNNSRDSS